jgi:hypothetical protein
METPETYLSTSGGAWRVIHQGVPLCADTPERERAEACARHYKLTPAAIWNGDRGEFQPIEGQP